MDYKFELEMVSASQLAYILSTTRKKANHIIAIKLFENFEQAKLERKLNKDLKIAISKLEGLFVIDLKKAIIDIRENSMSRPHFRKFLFLEYPMTKLREEFPSKKIRLPRGLRSMLREQDLNEIESYWNNRYGNTRFPEWNDSVDYYPVLKP